MLERRIEEAALNSWPAFQQLLLDGWLLRFTDGYTKRANAVMPLYPSYLPMPEKIAVCERFYRERQLPSIFRLLSFVSTTQELDLLLAQRGYQRVDRTHVMSTELLADADAAQDDPALRIGELTDWLPVFCLLSQSAIEDHQTHHEMLRRILARPLFATLSIDDEPVACGLGVLEHDLFGLFDIVTAPEQRRKGYGTRLAQGMVNWARRHGAGRAYLQVVATNHGAQRMYERLGFRELYQYWYRIPPREG